MLLVTPKIALMIPLVSHFALATVCGTCGDDCPPPVPPYALRVADYDYGTEYSGEPESACLNGGVDQRGQSCEKVRPNSLDQCAARPWCDSFEVDGVQIEGGGGICVSYETDPAVVLAGEGALRLDFDVTADPIELSEGQLLWPYAGYSEKLVSSGGRCSERPPINLKEHELDRGNLTFWIRRAPGVDLEVTLKSADDVESFLQDEDRKPWLSDFVDEAKPCDRRDGWTKVCIPVQSLIKSHPRTRVDVERLWEISFGFPVIPRSAREGTVWLDDVRFEASGE